jgi:hypothetical protein
MRIALVLALAACSKSSSVAPTAVSDTLWGLAPAGTRGAIVIAPTGVAKLERGYADVRKLAELPDLAPIKEQLGSLPLDAKLADYGMSPAKGAALFMTPDSMVAILPVVDRDKFLAKVGGTKGNPDQIDTARCGYVRGHYACATSEDALAKVGKSDIKKHVFTRGDIEAVAAELPFAKDMTFAAVVQLSRGAAELSARVTNPPEKLREMFATTVKPQIDAQHTSSFAVVDMKAWLPKTPDVLVDDVTVEKLIDMLKGPMTIVTPAGAQTMTIEQTFTDAAPAKKVIEACDKVPVFSEWLSAKADGAVCHVQAPNWEMPLDVKLDAQTVKVGPATKLEAKTVPLTEFGNKLAQGTWSLVFWGRGTMLAGQSKTAPTVEELSPEAAMVIRATSLLSELGLAVRQVEGRIEINALVRTAFANPDDVVAKLLAISAKDVVQQKSQVLAEPIASSAPTSPFAADFAAGHVGLLVPTTFAGVVSRIVIPPLMMLRGGDLDEAPPQ